MANAEAAQASAAVTSLGGGGGGSVGYAVAAIACAPLGFGVTRTLGWAPPGIDAPHLALELGPGAAPGSVQCYLSLMPRAAVLLDLASPSEEGERVPLYSRSTTRARAGRRGCPALQSCTRSSSRRRTGGPLSRGACSCGRPGQAWT